MHEPTTVESGTRLPRILCAAMALQFAAGGAVLPFVALLLRDRGLEFDRISLIFSASSATLMVFPFIWGMLADRFVPLDRLFAVMNLLAGGALAVMASQTGFVGLLLAFTWLTACLNPTFMLINALSFHHLPQPQAQFGRLRAWGSVGWTIPFLPISLWLGLSGRSELNFTLYLGGFFCLMMAGLTLRLPHTPPGADHRQDAEGRSLYGPALRRLLRNPNYMVLLLAHFCVAGSFSIFVFYSFPLLEDLGVPRAWLAPIQAIGIGFEFVLFRWQAALLRRWNYTAVILFGCLALMVRQLCYAMLDDVWILALSYALVSLVVVFNFIGTSLLVNVIAGLEVRATAQTVLILVGSGLGPTLANWAAGRLTAHFEESLRPIFFFAAALAGAAFLLVAWRGRQLNEAGRHKH